MGRGRDIPGAGEGGRGASVGLWEGGGDGIPGRVSGEDRGRECQEEGTPPPAPGAGASPGAGYFVVRGSYQMVITSGSEVS